jgi:hypothetical protein
MTPTKLASMSVSLERETRAVVDTATAAFHLNRQPQTLRVWASTETYPADLAPVRVQGRLGWPVAGIRKVLGVR